MMGHAQAQAQALPQAVQQQAARPAVMAGPFGGGAPAHEQQQHHHAPQQQSFQGGQGFGSPAMGGGPSPASSVMGLGAPPMAGGGGGMSSGVSSAPTPMAVLNDAACCSPVYMALTTDAVPLDAGVLGKAGMPFGLAVHPMAECAGSWRGRVPLVNFGAAGVIRCKKCRAYVNPFVRFTDAGRRWRCNFCTYVNDVPAPYFGPVTEAGVRLDADSRPELSQGSVEFVAPPEYMVRPPQPPVYMFVIDVSFSAVSSGMLAAACETLRGSLDVLSKNERAQVGFVSFDTTVHFYSMRPGKGRAQQLVVSDVNDLFLPVPEDLLINLSEAHLTVDALLASLPATFASTRLMDSALGAALEGAFQVMQHVGGKMVVFQACLPTLGPGKLKSREGPRMLGTEQEHGLLAPAPSEDGGVYKNKAIDFSKQQVSVDMFLFNTSYADVATLGALSRYTAGQVYYYPAYAAGGADAARFTADLTRDLSRTTGFEAVMRIRASKGVTINNFYGNFFIRGADLLALPNVTPETAFNVELSHEEALQPGSIVAVQAALLYTTSSGERRILVHTLAKAVTSSPLDLFARANVDSECALLGARAASAQLLTSSSPPPPPPPPSPQRWPTCSQKWRSTMSCAWALRQPASTCTRRCWTSAGPTGRRRPTHTVRCQAAWAAHLRVVCTRVYPWRSRRACHPPQAARARHLTWPSCCPSPCKCCPCTLWACRSRCSSVEGRPSAQMSEHPSCTVR